MTYNKNPKPLRVLQMKAIERAARTVDTADRNRTRECIELAHRYGEAAQEAESESHNPIEVPQDDHHLSKYPDSVTLLYMAIMLGITAWAWHIYEAIKHAH